MVAVVSRPWPCWGVAACPVPPCTTPLSSTCASSTPALRSVVFLPFFYPMHVHLLSTLGVDPLTLSQGLSIHALSEMLTKPCLHHHCTTILLHGAWLATAWCLGTPLFAGLSADHAGSAAGVLASLTGRCANLECAVQQHDGEDAAGHLPAEPAAQDQSGSQRRPHSRGCSPCRPSQSRSTLLSCNGAMLSCDDARLSSKNVRLTYKNVRHPCKSIRLTCMAFLRANDRLDHSLLRMLP